MQRLKCLPQQPFDSEHPHGRMENTEWERIAFMNSDVWFHDSERTVEGTKGYDDFLESKNLMFINFSCKI